MELCIKQLRLLALCYAAGIMLEVRGRGEGRGRGGKGRGEMGRERWEGSGVKTLQLAVGLINVGMRLSVNVLSPPCLLSIQAGG